MNKGIIEDFQSGEIIPYNNMMLDACHYTFVKTPRMYDIKSGP